MMSESAFNLSDKSVPHGEADAFAGARSSFLRVSVAAVFLLFFQTYMVAPLIPTLADSFHVDRTRVGLLIPAYTIPYALAALVLGAVIDRVGRRFLFLLALTTFPLASLAIAFAPNFGSLLALRAISGVINVGIVVAGLAMVGDLFPPSERGRAIGWIFGALAGGGAFGSTLGGILAPWIGWRGLFVVVAISGAVVIAFSFPFWKASKAFVRPQAPSRQESFVHGYARILSTQRGSRTYAYIFLNAAFHSGVFTWLGVLLHDRFGLGDAGIGLALLGYGVPGMLLGPVIGRLADRHGRRLIIPFGMLAAAGSAALLAPNLPLAVAMIAITVMSLGFDMTHPLFAGIATTLDNERRGQAMGLNTFSIFLGLGCGSLLFGALIRFGMPDSLIAFSVIQAALGTLAFWSFRSE